MPLRAVFLLALLALASGCSLKQMAVKQMGDALASGSSVFTSDDDPELVAAAMPFGLKLMESLLAESPRHEGLLFATASGFAQYSYAFVHQEAERLEWEDLDAAYRQRDRARRLYLRARDYGLRGLAVGQPEFESRLRRDPDAAVATMREEDVPMLFWTAAAWALAIALSKDDPVLVADLPYIDALIGRVRELDPAYGEGAVQAFLISWSMVGPDSGAEAEANATRHYERALALSGGTQASIHLTYAEAVVLPAQDREGFVELLQRALAVDPDARPEHRLANLVAQRQARWYLEHFDLFFLD